MVSGFSFCIQDGRGHPWDEGDQRSLQVVDMAIIREVHWESSQEFQHE